MVGKTVGHYLIEEKLGEGGMGVVYKARDTRLDRPVAVKVLPHDRVADPERKRRFIQEAKAASALNHPNIITIHDIGQAESIDFIAMEYVDGRTLDDMIGRKGLRLGEALKYAIQIADALTAAHAAGIIHRDLKPGNVMVTAKGQIKVLDFGLAKLMEALPGGIADPTLTLKPATEEGKIVGTIAYMSPEQAEGKKVDTRSDIFSFGSVLYEMVTGRRAFPGESSASTMAAILK
ncbi:MAG: serine/threonine protein kinase, partial [Candidatus Aminicenantes bacterium]|nr:serine/threonine protein kinase [Candidatus Aminicenantes bacterium]